MLPLSHLLEEVHFLVVQDGPPRQAQGAEAGAVKTLALAEALAALV
jgi:hypothetical protein